MSVYTADNIRITRFRGEEEMGSCHSCFASNYETSICKLGPNVDHLNRIEFSTATLYLCDTCMRELARRCLEALGET